MVKKMQAIYQKSVGNHKYYKIYVDNIQVGSVVIFHAATKDGQTFEYIERLSVETDIVDYKQIKKFVEENVMED